MRNEAEIREELRHRERCLGEHDTTSEMRNEDRLRITLLEWILDEDKEQAPCEHDWDYAGEYANGSTISRCKKCSIERVRQAPAEEAAGA